MVTIYALKDNGIIFYIGQTTNITDRMYNHFSSSKYCRTIKEKRINDILTNNRQLDHEILTTCDTEIGCIMERQYISEYFNAGYKLINKKPNDNYKPKDRKINDNKLNSKQVAIIRLIASDFKTSEISKIMSISQRTIESNKIKIRRLFKVNTIHAALVKAYRLNIVR